MVKEELIALISEDVGYNKGTVALVVESALKNITEGLKSGEKIKLNDFGIFETRVSAQRVGRNPHTGEEVPIPRRVTPHFKPGKGLKDAIIRVC